MGGHKPKAISGEHASWLSRRIKSGDFTLRGLVNKLAERGLQVDYRSVWEFVHAEKLSFKKSVAAGERDRPDVARRRAQWTKYQDRIEPERLVFIDETWTRTALRGRAPRGEMLTAKVPHGRWKTMTFLAALRHDRSTLQSGRRPIGIVAVRPHGAPQEPKPDRDNHDLTCPLTHWRAAGAADGSLQNCKAGQHQDNR